MLLIIRNVFLGFRIIMNLTYLQRQTEWCTTRDTQYLPKRSCHDMEAESC